MFNFVIFEGEETEKEFLEKCLEQWDITMNGEGSEMKKLMEVGTVFLEIMHRIDELD